MEISKLSIRSLLEYYQKKEYITDYDVFKFITNEEVKKILINLIKDKYFVLIKDFSKDNYILRQQVYYLLGILLKLYVEKEDLQREIEADEALLENKATKWKEAEKTEWRHDLASKRTFALEDLNASIANVEGSLKICVGMENDRRNR